MDQIKNSNADFLQNGTISGLSGSFNGENIKYILFDGGRVYAAHPFFDNIPTGRVTNKEASTMNYSAHATAVTIYDMPGKRLQSGNINSDKEAVSLSTYPKGIYIIEVKADKDVTTKKVIKE